MWLLFKELVAEKSKGKLTLMGIKKPVTFGYQVMDQNLEAIMLRIFG
jgi:polyisoprenoid-binding protein YceI